MITRIANPPAERESAIQAAAVEALQYLGYIVLVTTTHLGRGDNHSTKVTKGIPDLLVCHEDWPAPLLCGVIDGHGIPAWIGIEMKTRTGKLSREQRALHEAGLIAIARSAAEAVGIVRGVEMHLFGRTFGLSGEIC